MSKLIFDYIFLDLDGPILDGKRRHYKCYKDIIEKYGGTPLDIEIYWDMKTSKTNRDTLLKKSNFQGTYNNFIDDWMKSIEIEKNLELDVLKPNVVETLENWEKITNKLVLVTMRRNRLLLVSQLKRFRIYDFFDEVIDCPPQRKNTKYEALKNIYFSSAVFVGDTEEDMNTAKMLGIKSIAIINGLRKKEFLDADYFFDEIQDIPLNFFIKFTILESANVF